MSKIVMVIELNRHSKIILILLKLHQDQIHFHLNKLVATVSTSDNNSGNNNTTTKQRMAPKMVPYSMVGKKKRDIALGRTKASKNTKNNNNDTDDEDDDFVSSLSKPSAQLEQSKRLLNADNKSAPALALLPKINAAPSIPNSNNNKNNDNSSSIAIAPSPFANMVHTSSSSTWATKQNHNVAVVDNQTASDTTGAYGYPEVGSVGDAYPEAPQQPQEHSKSFAGADRYDAPAYAQGVSGLDLQAQREMQRMAHSSSLKRKRGDEAHQVLVVDAAAVMGNVDVGLKRQFEADQRNYTPTLSKSEQVSHKSKSKNQITSLAQQAVANKLRLEQQWQTSKANAASSRNRFGF